MFTRVTLLKSIKLLKFYWVRLLIIWLIQGRYSVNLLYISLLIVKIIFLTMKNSPCHITCHKFQRSDFYFSNIFLSFISLNYYTSFYILVILSIFVLLFSQSPLLIYSDFSPNTYFFLSCQ